ncbi:hypothetical protein [Terrabacter terrigena]|uniref:Lipoprotein n=1 Tax=Terrabacter terrigena TaxID=574718 RepID=A0ABW3N3K6_9MICO
MRTLMGGLVLVLLSGCAAAPDESAPEVGAVGATQEKWNSLHAQDARGHIAPNVAYDRDPKFAVDGDSVHDARFYSAMWTGDPQRLFVIRMREVSGTPSEAAVADALKMLPSDAQFTGPLRVLDVCAVQTLESERLAEAFGASGVEDGGGVAIYLSSGAAADHYDPTSVTDVTIANTFGNTDPAC